MDQKVQNFFRVFEFVGASPYKFTLIPGTGDFFIKAKPSSQLKAWGFYLTVGFLHLIKTSFFLAHLFQNYLEKEDYKRIVFHGIYFTSYISILFQTLPFSVGRIETMQLGNGATFFIHNFGKGISMPIFRKSTKLKLRVILFFCCNAINAQFLFMAIFIIFREDAWNHGSNVYKLFQFMGSPLIISIGAGSIMEAYYFFTVWGVFILEMYFNIIFFQAFTITVGQLTNPSAKTFSEMYQNYKSYNQLRLLLSLYNNTFGRLYIPYVTSCFGTICVLGVFVSIKLAYLRDVIIMITGIFSIFFFGPVVLVLTTFTGWIHENSKKVKRHLNSQGQGFSGKLARRILRAVKVVAVKSGNFYDIHKITSLTLLGMLANFSVSLLLSVESN
ncbi:unnamed protein product [Orchesella dallaii]|uniref:Gustatory receptor n=1 Tax=Orchesella dallaii TaxID=48710 RepID=A0ABP1S7F2_9HEXA